MVMLGQWQLFFIHPPFFSIYSSYQPTIVLTNERTNKVMYGGLQISALVVIEVKEFPSLHTVV